MNIFYTIFLYFFIYSTLGWAVETVYCRIGEGKWTNRGFLFGPYCPIYGFGSLIIIYFLNMFIDSPIQVFVLGLIFTSLLEYITSYLLEKLFNAKWWDYSTMKFNINGRICLLNSLEFATLGLALTYIIHPAISSVILKLPTDLIQLISTVLLTIVAIDTASTVISLLNLKEKLAMLNQITEKIKAQNPLHHKISDLYLYKELGEFRKNILSKGSIQIKRLLNAFPDFEFKDFKKQLAELKLDMHKLRQDMKDKKEVKKLKEKN